MPFVKVNAIKEAQELQQIFNDEPETKKMFAEYEKAHIEAEQVKSGADKLRKQLIDARKEKGITQKELEQRTGLTQQAISRVEIGKDVIPSLQTILKYADGIGCELTVQLK